MRELVCKGAWVFHPVWNFGRLASLSTILLLIPFPAATSSADALFRAVQNDDTGAVTRLIQEHANVNAREQDGATALAWAALRSNLAIAGLLLKAGADPNLTNELGVSPLSLAIENGTPAIAMI